MTELSILVDDEPRAVVVRRELPFPPLEVSAHASAQEAQDPVYNPAMLRRLHQSIEHAKQGKYVVKTMEELRRMADE